MKIQTLKDLKNALKDIPDELIEEFGVGYNPEFHEEGVALLVYSDESEFSEKWEKAEKVAPQIKDIAKWIANIARVERMIHEDDNYNGVGFEDSISSEDFGFQDEVGK